MRRYRFVQFDVFTDRPFGGNQLAVFPQAEGLTDAEMQAIATEMNYSETTFVLPAATAQALCRVRIFTPSTELPFAGHPVIGTTFALASEGAINPNRDASPITLELGIGPLEVELLYEGDALSFAWMRQPIPTFTSWQGNTARLLASVGLTSDALAADLPLERGSAGVPFLYIPLRSLDAIGHATPTPDLLDAMAVGSDGDNPHLGAYLFTLDDTDRTLAMRGVDAHGRMFAPGLGINEDPATGSGAGPLGAYLVRHGRMIADGAARIRLEQGVEMGRASRIEIAVTTEGETITGVRVGGASVLVAEGDLLLG